METGFTVFPMKQHLELVAGKIYQGSINIVNPSNATSDFHYKVVVTPYSVVGENYTADLATRSTYSQVLDWITIEEPEGLVKPNEVKKVEYKIAVPLDAPAGGQYAAFLVQSNTELETSEGAQIKDVYGIASVVYATIDGETTHGGEIVQNFIPGFVTNGAPTLGALIMNSGNVHETAEITIEAKNAVTGERVFPREDTVNVYEEVIMPGTTRYVSREVSELPALGVFSVTQSVTYLDEVSLLSETVVMCPLWFLLLVILTIGAFIGTVAALVSRHRHKKPVIL